MKIPPRSVSMFLASALPVAAAYASPKVIPGTPSFASRAASNLTSVVSRRSAAATTSSSRRRATPAMFFQNFFGGGAYASKIDYAAIPHPADEMGAAAEKGQVLSVSPRDPHLSCATFAGGCFWGLELAYQRIPGVEFTAVGYTHGEDPSPNYGQVCAGSTGHTEAVMVYYDPTVVGYGTLLDAFFGRVDVTTINGQGKDYGTQYRTGVYTHTAEQAEEAAVRFAGARGKLGEKREVATECLEARVFWPAEKYHQQYLEKGGQNASKNSSERIRCYG